MQQIKIDFDNPGLPQHLEAMEGDAQSRFFQATLYRSGAAYTPPAGVAYSIMYRGFGEQNQGWYDTIEDDTGKRDACVASGNVVTCEIDRHALIVPGHVSIVLCITNDRGYMLKSRPILTDARNDNYDDTVEVESFFRITGKTSAWWLQNKKDVQDLVDQATTEATKAKNSADASATSAAASKGSADNSAASASASSGSAAAAARSEGAAAGSATQAAGSASAAEMSKTAAATSESNAAKHEEAAKKAADEAGAKAGTDKTLSIENAPADAKATGDALAGKVDKDVILDEDGNVIFYSKDEVEDKIKEILAKQQSEDYARIKFWVSTDPTSPAELFGGTWEQIAQDRVLMGASGSHAADTTVEAGLPNITGLLRMRGFNNDVEPVINGSGAMVRKENSAWSGDHAYASTLFGDQAGYQNINFDASKSNGIYGKSSTVQPAAYYVYMWRRVA